MSVTYVLQYCLHGTNTWISMSPVATPTETVAGLIPGTSYDFRVYAVSSISGQSAPTAPIKVITAPSPNESPDQTSVTISGGGSITDSVGAVWAITSTGQVSRNGVVDSTTASVTQIAYVNHVFWELSGTLWHSWSGTWSSPGTATSPLTGTLGVPTNLIVTEFSTTTGAVDWNGVAGIGVTYVAQYSVHGLNTWTSSAPTHATSMTFINLSLGTSYDVRVQAVQGVKTSSYSNVVLLTTSGSSGTTTGVPLGTGTGGSLNRMFKFWRMAGIQNHFGDVGGTNIYQVYDTAKSLLDFMNPFGPGNGGPFVIRDETRANITNTNALGAAGYKFCLYTGFSGGINGGNGWNPQGPNIQSMCTSGYVAFVEGPNKVVNDNLANYTAISATAYLNQDASVRWQMDLYNTFHPLNNCFGEPMQVIIASYGTSSAFNSTSFFQAATAAGITLSNYSDCSNVHSYLNWAWPWGAAGGSYAGTTQLDAEGNNNANATGFTTKPKAGTELGMQHDLSDSTKWGTEHTCALLMPQMYLDCFKRGYVYAAAYELGDRGAGSIYENSWGLSTVDGLPYEAMVVLRWMGGLTVDTGTNRNVFYTGSITATVSNLGTYGDHRWFQKSDGTVVGMIWDNAAVYSNTSGTQGSPITVPVKQCVVTFGATYGTISVFEPNVGASDYSGANWINCPITPNATQTVTNVSSVTINMSDHMVMVIISP